MSGEEVHEGHRKTLGFHSTCFFPCFSPEWVSGPFSGEESAFPSPTTLGIISPTTLAGFNPANNLLRFVCFISLPSLFLVGVYALRVRGTRPAPPAESKMAEGVFPVHQGVRGRWACWLGIIGLTLLIGLSHPTYHAWGPFDFFHEGESLTAAQDYLAGKIPYKDSTSVHGVIQDPLRSVAAFAIFGRSIGSARAFESTIKILCFVLLSIVLMMITGQPCPGCRFSHRPWPARSVVKNGLRRTRSPLYPLAA